MSGVLPSPKQLPSEVKTKRRVIKDVEDGEFYFEESSEDEANQNLESNLPKFEGKYETTPQMAPISSAFKDSSHSGFSFRTAGGSRPANRFEGSFMGTFETGKTTERKSPGRLIQVLLKAPQHKKYLKPKQGSPTKYSCIDNNKSDRDSYRSGTEDLSAILDRVKAARRDNSRIQLSPRQLRHNNPSPLKQSPTAPLDLDISRVLLGGKASCPDVGHRLLWVDRIAPGDCKSLVSVPEVAIKSIKKSSLNEFRFNDCLPYVIYIIDCKAYLAQGTGMLLNSYGYVLYEGEVSNGRLEGKGILYNSRLSMESANSMASRPLNDYICGFLESINDGLTNLYFKQKMKKFSSQWSKYSGGWRKNRCEGKGTIVYSNGAILYGTFSEGNIHGICSFKDKQLQLQGVWDKNVLLHVLPSHN